MREINKISEAVFEKIRDRFENVSLGDADAKATQNPADAKFFNFDYVSGNKNYGSITVSIVDGKTLKIYFSRNLSQGLDAQEKQNWYKFLRDMREFSKRNLLNFEPRDISRPTLKQRDIEVASRSENTYSSDEVDVAESKLMTPANKNQSQVQESRMFGTSKSSYENNGKTKIIVRHTESINPEYRGARGRKIKSIFIENSDGERIKLPHNSLRYARAMAQHIDQGGNISDDFGKRITNIAEEIAKLQPFKTKMIRRTFEDTETQDIVNTAAEYLSDLTKTLESISRKRGYTKAKESFASDEDTITDDFDVDAFRDRFVRKEFDSNLDEALPLVQKAYNMKKQNKYVEQFENWADAIVNEAWEDSLTDQDIQELASLLVNELPVGVDALNATSVLYKLEGSDSLFDHLTQIAQDEGPETDVSLTVLNWIEENNPELYNQIIQAPTEQDDTDEQEEPDEIDTNDETDTETEIDLGESASQKIRALAAAGLLAGGVAAGSSILQSKNVPVVQAMQSAMQDAKLQGDVDAYNEIRKELQKVKTRLDVGRDLNYVAAMAKKYGVADGNKVDESYYEENPVYNAVLRRIDHSMPELYTRHGTEAVEAAVSDLATRVGDVEEIGTSDVSIWVKEVIQDLQPDSVFESIMSIKRLAGL